MSFWQAFLIYFCFLVEFLFGALIFFSPRTRKPSFWMFLTLFAAGLLGICFLSAYVFAILIGSNNLDFVVYSLLGAGIVVFLFLAHDERKKKIFFSSVAGICVRMGGSWLASFFFLFLPYIPYFSALIRLAIILLTYIPIYFTLAKTVREDLNFDPGKGELAFILVGTFALLPMAYLTRVVEDNLPLQIYLVLVLALIPYMLLAFEAIAFRHFRSHYQSELERESIASELSQVESMQEVIAALNIKIHDLKHQLQAGAGEAAMEGIGSSIAEYEAFVKTGYDKLDTILTQKKVLSTKLGIPFQALIDGKRYEFLKLEDLIGLFGNLLDNAIESTKDQGEGKYIVLHSSLEGHFLCLNVSNSCPTPPLFGKNGLPRTTKKDASMHGFGTQSILRIASNYGGSATFRYEDGSFQATVLLPIGESAN